MTPFIRVIAFVVLVVTLFIVVIFGRLGYDR